MPAVPAVPAVFTALLVLSISGEAPPYSQIGILEVSPPKNDLGRGLEDAEFEPVRWWWEKDGCPTGAAGELANDELLPLKEYRFEA